MVLFISSIEEARGVLAEVREIVGPIQLGDLPQDYPLIDKITEAHANTAAVLAFVAREFTKSPETFDRAVFSSASNYLHTLSCELIGIDGVSERTKKVLELCLVTPGFMASRMLNIPAGV